MPTILTTLDILYISLSLAALVLVTALTILLIHVTLVVRDVRNVTKTAGDVTSKFHSMILAPISMVAKITEAIEPRLEGFIKAQMERIKRKSKK